MSYLENQSHLSFATREAELGVLRGFFRFLVREEVALSNPAQSVSLKKGQRGNRRAPSRETSRSFSRFPLCGPRSFGTARSWKCSTPRAFEGKSFAALT